MEDADRSVEILNEYIVEDAKGKSNVVEKTGISDSVPDKNTNSEALEEKRGEANVGKEITEDTEKAPNEIIATEQNVVEVTDGVAEFEFQMDKDAVGVIEIPKSGPEKSAGGEENAMEEGLDGQESDVEGYEGDEAEDTVREAESTEIMIPNLYEDMSVTSLPDLQEQAPKEKLNQEMNSALSVYGKDLSEDRIGEEATVYGTEYEELSSVEDYINLEEAEVEITEKEKPHTKRVEISGMMGSDSDLFFKMLDRDVTREEVAEKMKLEQEPNALKSSGVEDLLNSLIEEVIHKSEEIDPEAVLRLKIDRLKLLRALKVAMSEIQEQHKRRLLLNTKVVEYFLKKKYYRALTEDSPETILDAMNRYRDCLKRLDHSKALESSLKQQIDASVHKLRGTETHLKDLCNSKVEALNKRLKEVGLATASVKTGQSMSEKAVDAIIMKMNNLRDQISELRLVFIKAQHKMAHLNHEAKKLEDIGEGLKMVDYEQLRAETQGLGDKVEGI